MKRQEQKRKAWAAGKPYEDPRPKETDSWTPKRWKEYHQAVLQYMESLDDKT